MFYCLYSKFIISLLPPQIFLIGYFSLSTNFPPFAIIYSKYSVWSNPSIILVTTVTFPPLDTQLSNITFVYHCRQYNDLNNHNLTLKMEKILIKTLSIKQLKKLLLETVLNSIQGPDEISKIDIIEEIYHIRSLKYSYLINLPFEILFLICSKISIKDVINISKSSVTFQKHSYSTIFGTLIWISHKNFSTIYWLL